jgi:HAE1 family hydrophobic/amphiphilic exporter-1
MRPLGGGLTGDAALQGQMAIAVIGGLVTSTALALVMVPAGFTLMDDFERWLGRHLLPQFSGRQRGAATAPVVASLSSPAAQSDPA